MSDVRVQIAAAATLSKTPAGRYQMALEWAQAGVITTDEWRRLTEHPDLDRVLSMYTQGIDSIEKDIEAIEEGRLVTPEPFGNLALMVRTAQMAYLRDRDLGAPEEILEALRTYAVQAAEILSRPAAATASQTAAMPAGPEMGAPPMRPPMPSQPVAALAPQAMNLMAS
jgi:H2-forming N5,N10-methylenetetrahydromethanopterin dehydrogenase-like enzyme